MRIPTSTHVVGLAFPSLLQQGQYEVAKASHNHEQDGWSSLIGIITAICGNILISIALNTQRYAHIKLNKQWVERRRLLKRAERRREAGVYRVQPVAIKERERLKRRSTSEDVGSRRNKGNIREPVGDQDAEREPLLSSFRSDNEEDDIINEEDQESDSETKAEEEAQKSYLRSPYWWAGIIMMSVGEAGNFLAYGFAPASIVSPLGVVAIISNCIIAPFFMKERFRWRDLLGVLIAVAGAVTVVLSASDNNPKLGPEEIWALITRWEFETYLGISLLVIICLMLASNKYGDKSIFIDLGLVGLFGGYTALSTKGVASMLSYTLFRALTFPVTYLLVTILVFTAVMQIKYVNRALQRFDATQVIPTQFVMFTLSVILGSAVLYRDFERTRGDDAGKFIGGCAMTFMGVWLITSARERPSDGEEGLDIEDEEAIVLRDGEQYEDDIPVNGSHSSLGPVMESSEDDSGSNERSVRGHESNISLPESLERNHWNSSTPSTNSTPLHIPSAGYGTSQRSSLADPSSPLLENPWLPSQEQPNTSKSSIQRFLEPFSSIFPHKTSKTRPSVPGARHSAPDLAIDIEADNTIPHTPRHASHYAAHGTIPVAPHLIDGAHSRRSSRTNIFPGPFTSPLSSSLSAIVADSLRRRVDFPRIRSRRAGRSRLPNTSGDGHSRQRGNSDATDAGIHAADVEDAIRTHYAESPSVLRHTRSHEAQSPSSVPTTPANFGRRQTLNNKLGEFFRGSRTTPRTRAPARPATPPPPPPGESSSSG